MVVEVHSDLFPARTLQDDVFCGGGNQLHLEFKVEALVENQAGGRAGPEC